MIDSRTRIPYGAEPDSKSGAVTRSVGSIPTASADSPGIRLHPALSRFAKRLRDYVPVSRSLPAGGAWVLLLALLSGCDGWVGTWLFQIPQQRSDCEAVGGVFEWRSTTGIRRVGGYAFEWRCIPPKDSAR